MKTLEEIKARLGAATPGPWEFTVSNDDYPPITYSIYTASHGDTVAQLPEDERALIREGPQAEAIEDAAFIAAAPADIARLTAAVEAVLALGQDWESKAGPGTDTERIFGKQVVSVEFAVEQIRAAIENALTQ